MARYRRTLTGRVPFTAEEEAEWDAFEAQETQKQVESKKQDVRNKRNFLLQNSDWTVLQDSPLTDAQTADWVIYRQALRDITDHANFPYLNEDDWPTKP